MSKKAFARIKAGMDEALEIARGNKEPAAVHYFVVVDGKAVRLSAPPNRLHGAFIKPDGDAA